MDITQTKFVIHSQSITIRKQLLVSMTALLSVTQMQHVQPLSMIVKNALSAFIQISMVVDPQKHVMQRIDMSMK